MPVEFAVAVDRFRGLVRPFYVINNTGFVDVFGADGSRNLSGGKR
jgi:hypothetical protein